ncbi:hypothetical protein QJQ45_013852 [Haematococcus lacustris]|nr:hypothetical protein QJQ45_013852 [Haematococcus lacustris]
MREHLAKVAPIDQRLKRVEVVVDNVNDQMAQHNKGKPKAPKVPGGPRIDGRVLVSGLSQYYVPFITIQVFSPHGEQIWQQAHIYSESHFNVGAPGPGTYKVCFVNPWESRTEAIVDLVYITLAHLRSRGGPVLVPKGTQASRDTEVAGVAHMEDVQRTILGLTEFMQASSQKYLQRKLDRHQVTMVSNKQRTLWYTVLEVAVLLCVSGIQIFAITRFFKTGKIKLSV